MDGTQSCPRCGSRLRVGSGCGACARCLLTDALRDSAAPELDALPAPGDLIGSCRVVRLLGEGGMGMVYLAQQQEPIARPVALKIIKLGMDTRAVLARFQSEQQALGLMDHTNIARVYEAGSNSAGRPYFIMEYVPGLPINSYCDLHRLDIDSRLSLFLEVANAVQHAHQKGVIHRDLKPSNILIVERDGQPVPKIIDFGLAKATEKNLKGETLFTQAGVLIGTPGYMSPEQASAGAVDIDTRTDIYSLGVLLYELLVGTLPFDSDALGRVGFDEIRRIILEEDPPAPTRRLQMLGPKAAEFASLRATDTGGLIRGLRGDLDWIAMKALEKECGRRYQSASELAADIERHLHFEPVVAARAGSLYRFRKFLHKHSVATSVIVALPCLLVGMGPPDVQHYLRKEPVTAGPAGLAYRSRKFVRRNRPAVVGLSALIVLLLFWISFTSAVTINLRDAKSAALRENYAASVAAAEMLLRDNQSDAARRRLSACDSELRNWEWRHLWHKSDSSLARWQSQGVPLRVPSPSSIAFDAQRFCWSTSSTVECREGPGYSWPAVFPAGRVLGLSQDGALAVVEAGTIDAVDAPSMKRVSTCRDCRLDAGYVAVSANGKWAATPDGSGTLVWEISSGRTVAKLPAGPVKALSPDGRQAALAVRGLELWQVSPAHRRASFINAGEVTTAAFSPDGARLAVASDRGALEVLNSNSAERPVVLAAGGPRVQAIAFSPDGRLVVAAAVDLSLRIWLDGRLIQSLPAFADSPGRAVAFSPDGLRLAVVSQSNEVAVWDAATFGGQLLGALGQDSVTAVAASPDSKRLAAGLLHGGLELLETDGTFRILPVAHRARILSAAFSPDGKRLLTGSADRSARLWDSLSGAPGIELSGHQDAVTAVAFSPNEARVVTGSKDGTVRVWDAESGLAILTIRTNQPLNSVVFTPSGRELLTASGDPSDQRSREPAVRLWESGSGERIMDFTIPESETSKQPWAAMHATLSADGGRVLAVLAPSGETVVWDSRTGAVLAALQTGPGTRHAVFTPDGRRIAAASHRGSVGIWDAQRYRLLLMLQAGESIGGLVFSPDGARLLAPIGIGIRVWDTRAAKPAPRQSPWLRNYPFMPLDL